MPITKAFFVHELLRLRRNITRLENSLNDYPPDSEQAAGQRALLAVEHHNREMLIELLEAEKNITIMRGVIPTKLENGGVIAEQNKEEITIAMDSLVFAGRLFPVNDLGEALKEETNVINVGDCVEAGTIMDAVWGGFNAVSALE